MPSGYLGPLSNFLNYLSRYFVVNMTYKVKLGGIISAKRPGGPGNYQNLRYMREIGSAWEFCAADRW